MIALGGGPTGDDEEIEDSGPEESEDDGALAEAVKTLLDPEADMETRVEAFRQAVKGCGY
jgi:hypothetical protein